MSEATVVCVSIPRFAFIATAGRGALALGPAALAPEPGRTQAIGEVSPAAEPFGLRQGMRLGEALARCPELALIPPDPLAVATEWERLLIALEGAGAAIEPGAPGICWFDAAQLARIHGHRTPPVAVRAAGGAAPPWLPGVLAAVRDALRPAVARVGAGPSRFCAQAAALRAGARAAEFVTGGDALAAEPASLLTHRPEAEPLVAALVRLGVATLGDLRRLGRPALADRFGRAGELAFDLACGLDAPLRPRTPGETIEELLELPDPSSGSQLAHALELLIDRLLARGERRGRTLRSVVLGAQLVEGGTWQERVVFREPLGDPLRMRLALGRRLALLPAPAETLRLVAEGFGPGGAVARPLFDDDRARRAGHLREAVRQVRVAAGPDAALRVLELDAGSRVPERRVAFTPLDP